MIAPRAGIAKGLMKNSDEQLLLQYLKNRSSNLKVLIEVAHNMRMTAKVPSLSC